MGRPIKAGLSYFPKDVDYYEDFKIMDLMNEYGPLGQTIYDIVISMVYREGYFLEFKNFEQLKKNLPVKIIKTIGNRWVNKKDFVLQVILSCADIGLFDHDLLMQGVITSVGIQRRYDTVTVRNKVQKTRYRLIDEKGQPLLNEPLKPINVTETSVNVTETNINNAEIQQKKIKENKSKENIKYFSNENLNDVFRQFLELREQKGRQIVGYQIQTLIERLEQVADTDEEKIQAVKNAIAGDWSNFYPVKKEQQNKKTFNDQRQYDYQALERRLIENRDKRRKQQNES